MSVGAFLGTVSIVAPFPPPYGGMSLQAEKLVSLLQKEGIAVRVVATNPCPPRLLGWVQRIAGVRTLLREVQYLFALIRTLPACDIVHHFSASGLFFFAHTVPVLVLGSWFKKRVILNYRGGNAAHFLGDWSWCVVPLMRLATSVCVPSEFLQQVFSKWALHPTLLPNIADTERFAWHERRQFAPTLLVTRHLEPMYNTECALRAFRSVKEAFPDAILSVAGDGSDAARLRALVSEWKLSGVRFLGAVAADRLPALYASHDIYINSSNVDNFPGALVEAACSGLPIVTTEAGGIPWMIRDHHNGVLVKLGDHEALAAGVMKILWHPDLGRRLARNAQNWAEQFSWRNVLPVLLEFYEASESRRTCQVSEPPVSAR